MMTWRKSESTIRPEQIEKTKSTVYLRKNIKEIQRIDQMYGDELTLYEYEETKLTYAEYDKYLQIAEAINIRQIRADVDYIALCAGVNLEV